MAAFRVSNVGLVGWIHDLVDTELEQQLVFVALGIPPKARIQWHFVGNVRQTVRPQIDRSNSPRSTVIKALSEPHPLWVPAKP